MQSMILIFELNCQSNDTPSFHAPEAICWLAGIFYGSVRVTDIFLF